MQSDIVDAPPKFNWTGSYILEDTNFPGFGKMQLHLASAHSPRMKVTRRNQLIRRGSKTMKNDTIFSIELVCQDARLASSSHPMTCFVLRHHIDGVSSPLTCASVLCIREDRIKPTRTEAIHHRSELCWSWRKKRSALAQRWTPGWLLQGNSSVDVGNRWQQQFVSDNDSCAGWVQVAGFRDHNLRGAFWLEYLSDPLQITILKRNLDLQIMEDLMQSSKRHYSWHTLGTCLFHK